MSGRVVSLLDEDGWLLPDEPADAVGGLPEKTGDVVFTPPWVAADMIDHFAPSGRILDPCRGTNRVFFDLLAEDGADVDWCEVLEGRDFFGCFRRADWVIGNPPYSLTREWFRHSYLIADHLLYLVPLRNVFSGYGFIREIHQFGGIREIRTYGTGGSLGFPMGNAVGAFHIERGYTGETRFTFPDEVAVRAGQESLFDLGEAS